MDLEADVVIIGGGMAGLIAGSRISEAGKDVVLLQKGQGATSYSSGAIDIIGYLPDAVEPVQTPAEALSVIAQLYPLHPYSIAGYTSEMEDGQETTAVLGQIAEAVDYLKKQLEGTLAPLEGTLESNFDAITVLGTTKPASLLQKSMIPPDSLETSNDSLLLFAGIQGYPDFNAKSATKAYLRDRMIKRAPPRRIAFCELEISPFGNLFNISGSEIARHLDHPEAIDEFTNQIKNHAERIGATSVALPPILGIRKALVNKEFIEKETGLHVFELLGLPPSVPGLRLQKSLEMMFIRSGGRILQGHEAIGYSAERGVISGLRTKGPSREVSITARAFVLTTGKFIGGGLSGNKSGISETVFDLMTVTGEFYSANQLAPSRSTSRFAISPLGQPLFSGGLSVDPHLRPVQKNGLERARNLFCAGSVMAGYNYSTEKSGLGVAATTGYTAASNVVAYLEEVA